MQELTKQQLTDRFAELVEQLNQRMHCQPPDDWADLELTIPQIRALMSLRQGPERMGKISGYLGCTLSSTTSIMDRLVDKGLVQRAPDPNDRRVVTIGLTSRGADAMEQFWRIGRMKIEALAEPLNPKPKPRWELHFAAMAKAWQFSSSVRRLGLVKGSAAD